MTTNAAQQNPTLWHDLVVIPSDTDTPLPSLSLNPTFQTLKDNVEWVKFRMSTWSRPARIMSFAADATVAAWTDSDNTFSDVSSIMHVGTGIYEINIPYIAYAFCQLNAQVESAQYDIRCIVSNPRTPTAQLVVWVYRNSTLHDSAFSSMVFYDGHEKSIAPHSYT